MSALSIFVVVLAPMTALLVWVVVCELRGVPAFHASSPPEQGELDAMGRWILAAVCAALAVIAFAVGRVTGVVLLASSIAAVAALASLIWTIGQSVRQALAEGRGADLPAELTPFHLRFAQNFRRTIIRLPVALVAYG